jgi:hypothetical protein
VATATFDDRSIAGSSAGRLGGDTWSAIYLSVVKYRP